MRPPLNLLALATAFLTTTTLAQDLLSVLADDAELSTLLSVGATLPQFTALANASNITIFAPTNDAFDAVDANSPLGRAIAANDTSYIAATLAYHVVEGNYTAANFSASPKFVHTLLNSSTELNGQPAAEVTGGQFVELLLNGETASLLSGSLAESNVTQADIIVGGITIHKINRVLTIPDTISGTALAAGQNVIVAALVLANLAQTIDAEGDITVFVPNNAAFQAVGSALLAASPEDLASILQYHVVNGSVLFTTAASNTTVESLEGSDLNLSVVKDDIFVNNARVEVPNVLVRNGVVHLINGVLNPNATDVNTNSLSPTGTPSPAFSGASSASDLPFTSTQATATSTIVIPAIVTNAPQTTDGASGGGGSGSNTSSSSSSAGAMPMVTAAANLVGAGLFMAGAFIV